VDGCETDPNICQIICGDANCDPGQCPDVEVDAADMNADKCAELCIASRDKPDDKPCRFWRYDRVSAGGGAVNKVCTFLASDQCQYHNDCSGACECDDVGCPGENGGVDPPKKSCLGPIVYYPGSGWIHWTCYNTEHPELGNPYNPSTVLFADTICTTTKRCADWDGEEDKKLKVVCDGNVEADNGRWVADQEVGNEANYNDVLGDGNGVIGEHNCKGGANPAKLVVTIANMGVGGELSCEIPDTDEDDQTFTITAPNKCVLLCDYHLAMVIEGRLDGEVSGEFKFYVTNVDPEVEIDDTNVGEKIKCW